MWIDSPFLNDFTHTIRKSSELTMLWLSILTIASNVVAIRNVSQNEFALQLHIGNTATTVTNEVSSCFVYRSTRAQLGRSGDSSAENVDNEMRAGRATNTWNTDWKQDEADGSIEHERKF